MALKTGADFWYISHYESIFFVFYTVVLLCRSLSPPPYSASQTWIFCQILLAQMSAQKVRNRGEFQRRGQKNWVNSLQMCLRAVWANAALPSKEGEGRNFNEIWTKYISDLVQLVLAVSPVFQGREEEATREHVYKVFTLWNNCCYAECMLVILKATAQSCLG